MFGTVFKETFLHLLRSHRERGCQTLCEHHPSYASPFYYEEMTEWYQLNSPYPVKDQQYDFRTFPIARHYRGASGRGSPLHQPGQLPDLSVC